MACCGDREKNKASEIPQLSGELKIWNEDNSIKTESLNEQEIWTLRAILNYADREDNPMEANANARATIKALAIKVGQNAQPEAGCCGGGCGCKG